MNQNKPLVTIVTVTYNAEIFLERTIKSIVEQDYPNIEYIIIDGGSNDNTVEIIKQYNKHIDFWISEKDEGIYYAMNKAIKMASGEWINFMNAGDTFVSSEIIKKITIPISKDIDVVCGGINVIDNNTSYYESPSSLNMINEKFPCNHQAMFTRVNIIKKYKFNTFYKIAADADLMLKLHHNEHTFKFINEPIANYLKDGFWNDNFVKAHLELLYISSRYSNKNLLKHSSYIELQEYDKEYSKEFIHFFIQKLDDLTVKYKNIAIYGHGLMGKMISDYLKEYVTVIFDKLNYNSLNVINTEDILKYKFDIIVISVFNKEDEIENDLLTLGVKREKILRLI